MEQLYILFIICLFLLANYLQSRFSHAGSDHYYHLGLIKAIKDNKHRFITSYPQIIGEKYFAYPQFYHWILSFFPQEVAKDKYWIFSFIINLLQISFFLIFSYSIYPSLSLDIPRQTFISISSLVFIFTPFSFAVWNAKNVGISARGFGLLLGQLYLYSILWFYLFGNVTFLVISFIFVFLILLSSQFAMQYVILSSPFLAIFFQNISIVISPVLAFLFFYLFMPTICINFVKGQFGHKYLYFKYLAKVFILKARYSIWRDFVYDLWVKLRTNFKRGLIYVYDNPLVSITLGIPFIPAFLIILALNEDTRVLFFQNACMHGLALSVLVCLVVFLLTSFRKTRFLGEPERYVEFCIPQVAILSVVIFVHNSYLFFAVLGLCILLVIAQLSLSYYNKNRGKSGYEGVVIKEMIKKIEEYENTECSSKRIFSNNIEFGKYILGQHEQFAILKPLLTSFYTGSFHFKEIFPFDYTYVAHRAILPLAEEFKIDWLIYDTNANPATNNMEETFEGMREIFQIKNYKIYKLCSKTSPNPS